MRSCSSELHVGLDLGLIGKNSSVLPFSLRIVSLPNNDLPKKDETLPAE